MDEQHLHLEVLQEYRDIQARRLENLIFRFAFSDATPEQEIFVKFRDSLWGKGLLHLQDPLSNDQRSVVKTPEDTPWALSLPGGKILERSEYKEAEQVVLWANKDKGDVVNIVGHPGIGKSVFLLWLLMRRLVLELPTAVQVIPGQVILFHKHGTSQFSHLESIDTYRSLAFSSDPREKIWVLVDSNQDLLEPAPIFRRGLFFVVQALSPRAPRSGWAKKVSYEHFYMKTWTRSEVQKARPVLGISEGGPYDEQDSGLFLFDMYDATPRELSMFSHRPNAYHDAVVRQVKEMTLPAIQTALGFESVDHASQYVIRIEPSPQSRGIYEKTIASKYVFQLLWDKYTKDKASETQAFYDLFTGGPIMASVAGWIFEFRMHQLLRSGHIIQLFPILPKSDGSVNIHYADYTSSLLEQGSVHLRLPTSAEYPLRREMELTAGRYYHPPNLNFPTVDSVFFIHSPDEPLPILLIFHMTQTNDEHLVNLNDLIAVDGLQVPPNTRKWYVVVTPFDRGPHITVPRKYFPPEMDVKKADEMFPVFHCPVSTDALLSPEAWLGPGLL